MSRASKVFLASSAAICGVSIWGVHWLQERESDNMYQGVIKDEARMKAKALSRSAASAIGLSTPSPSSPSSSSSTSTSTDALPPLTAGPSLLTGAANTTGASASLSSHPAPILQPAPVMDEDCETCRISPPPQLLEAQSAEQRRIEREARAKEYNEQKDLAARLRREQGQSQEGNGAGRVLDQTAGRGGGGRLV